MRRLFRRSSVGRWRLPKCQAIRVSAAASAARISASGSGAATTSTMRPSSSCEAVSRAQRDRLGQIEQKVEAAHAGHRDAAAMTFVEIEHDGIGGLARPGAGGNYGFGAQHRVSFKIGNSLLPLWEKVARSAG